MKNNRETKPVKQVKQDPDPMDFDFTEAFKNRLRVPKAVKDEIEARGHVMRWINVNEYRKAGGYHQSGWVPYKPSVQPGADELGGRDAEGLLRRGDVILATRSKEMNEAHKKFKAERNLRKKAYDKQAAATLRASLPGARISEGYEDNK